MFKRRIKNIQKFLSENDAVLITSNPNRLYFTGFSSSAGDLVITKEKAFFFIDFRYFEKAKTSIDSCEVVLITKLFSQLNDLILKEKIENIYMETSSVTIDFYKTLVENLKNVNISDFSGIDKKIQSLRAVKDSSEIALIKNAQEITDRAFSYILDKIKVGVTEKELALQLEFFMRKNGSEGVAFDFIVVSGKNTSLPHGVPTDKKIEYGDLVTMDFGAVVGGYRSDMTRTVAVGFVSDKQREVYNTVLSAQNAALEKIKAGEICCEIDAVSRNIISKAGYGECFGHGLGHSVGIEIHENPAFNTRDKTVLESGMVITVEPGIYIENEFGVRIEDMIKVTENGIENLTKSNKELIVV